MRPLGQQQTSASATAKPTAVLRCDPATQWRPPAGNVALNDLAMVAPDEGWIVGNTAFFPFVHQQPAGVIYHLVHGQLVRLSQTYPGTRLVAISMDSLSDGWVVSDNVLTGTGDRAVVLHYHLGQWSLVDVPALDAVFKGPPGTYGGNLQSISVRMFGPDAGWMFAETNIPRDLNTPASRPQVVILRYESGVWTPIAAPAVSLTTELFALSAVSADEAWIVSTDYASDGTQTTLFAHFVSGAWSLWPRTFPGITQQLTMLSPTDGWAFGGDGPMPMLHYDGTAWAPASLPPALASQGVKLTASSAFYSSSGDLWFDTSNSAGDLLEEYANGHWRQFAWPYSDVGPVAMTATSPTELWGIGAIGHPEGCPPANVTLVEQGALVHFQQGRWTEQILP